MLKKQTVDKGKTMLPEKQILRNIKDGCSINSQAKKYKVSWNTIKKLCVDNKIHGKYERKATEKNILRLLKKQKVATSKEIAAHFGFSTKHHQQLRYRLQSMVRRKKIKRKKLGVFKTFFKYKHKFFEGYMQTYLFYLTDSDFKKWIKKLIPTDLPVNVSKVLTRYLNDNGVNYD